MDSAGNSGLRPGSRGRFKTTSLSKTFASDSSRKVLDNLKRLKAARSRNRASSSIHCAYDSRGRRLIKNPKTRRRRTTRSTQGMSIDIPVSNGGAYFRVISFYLQAPLRENYNSN